MKISWRNYSILFFLIVTIFACEEKRDGRELEKAYLEKEGLLRDLAIDSTIRQMLPGLNIIAKRQLGKTLVLAKERDLSDTSQILLIPYISTGKKYPSSAYSDLKNRVILLQPTYIQSFVDSNALNPDTALEGVIILTLLHELGHFKLGKEGAFDKPAKTSTDTGEMQMDTEPIYLTSEKKVELNVDSLAIAMVKQEISIRPATEGYFTATQVQTILPGLEFQVFGTRMIKNFGSNSINYLRDTNSTHPNMELRLAFMNYFLSLLPEKRRMIDEYIYEREVAPVHRQELDPRIYQGNGKN